MKLTSALKRYSQQHDQMVRTLVLRRNLRSKRAQRWWLSVDLSAALAFDLYPIPYRDAFFRAPDLVGHFLYICRILDLLFYLDLCFCHDLDLHYRDVERYAESLSILDQCQSCLSAMKVYQSGDGDYET